MIKICKKGNISDRFVWISGKMHFLHEKKRRLGMGDFGSFRGACGVRLTAEKCARRAG